MPPQEASLDLYAFYMYVRAVKVEFDPGKAQSNLRKHRVGFAHAEQTLRDERAITVEDPDSENERERTRIVSARKASPGEAEQYHAQGI